jgi:hypothetical protein
MRRLNEFINFHLSLDRLEFTEQAAKALAEEMSKMGAISKVAAKQPSEALLEHAVLGEALEG